MKDEFRGIIVNEFVGLNSKMYSMKKIDGKECNTAERVSTTTEFNRFKDVLFGKKIIRHKIKAKSINQVLMKLTKYLCHVLTVKDVCQIMEFIGWITVIKIMLQVVKRLKKIVIKKKRLKIVIKKIVIIEKKIMLAR